MRTIKELYELGWLKRPSAMENYMENPLLQELFPNYDTYAMYNYSYCKNTWSTGSPRSLQIEEGRGTHSLDSQTSIIGDSNPITEASGEASEGSSSDPLSDNFDLGKALTEESINWAKQQDYNSKVKKLKYKGKKDNSNVLGLTNTVCPCCTSRLVINEVGIVECSGDRLREWELEFLKFNQLNDEEKRKYIILQSNPDLFNDLYEKWNTIDEKTGFRAVLKCGYTNRLFNPISRFRTSLPDPVLVKKIERSLGRGMTEEERHGESDIWYKEGAYSDKYRKGAKKVKVPQIIFPDNIIG